jgi:hypothetical protein
MTIIYRYSCIFFFFTKINHAHKVIQEDIPGEINPLFTLNYDVQTRHTSNWAGI